MKIRDIISETREGKVPQDLDDKSMGGVIRMRDVGGYDRTYHLNRIMMAAAMADGRSRHADRNRATARDARRGQARPWRLCTQGSLHGKSGRC